MVLKLVLAALGLDLIITRSFIMQIFRDIPFIEENEYMHTLFNCPMCFGFWTGLLFGIIGYFVGYITVFELFLIPFIVSGIGYIITIYESK